MKNRTRFLSAFLLSVLYFGLAAQDNADCASAYLVCTQNRLHFTGQAGEGADTEEIEAGCFSNSELFGNPEKNSVWIRFDIETGGTVTFAIVPDSSADDIDFMVFTLPHTGDCKWKRAIRCMAAGDAPENVRVSPCMGPTGLREGEKDDSEDSGCADKGDNNWLKPLQVKDGEKYLLLVSNVSNAYNGFKIRFGGTATFACDEADEKKE